MQFGNGDSMLRILPDRRPLATNQTHENPPTDGGFSWCVDVLSSQRSDEACDGRRVQHEAKIEALAGKTLPDPSHQIRSIGADPVHA